ncbi:MAG: ABC transporter permease [Bacteroidales bacterium]|nr:ABC transporter permease [Bacteroidales bacterium]
MDFINYILAAIKALPAKGRRNGIKIISLGLGLAVSLVLLTKVCFEQTYDSCFDDSERIFYITESAVINNQEQSHEKTPGGIAPLMKTYFPGIEEASRWTYLSSDTKVNIQNSDRKASVERVILADSCFFKILDRKCLAGSLVEPLGVKANAVISSSMAMKLSGISNPISAAEQITGKVFTLEDDANGVAVTISGVYEDYPANTSYRPDIVVSLPSISLYGMVDKSDGVVGNDRYSSLIKLADRSTAEQINKGMSGFIARYIPREEMLNAGLEIHFAVHPYEEFHSKNSNSRNMMLVLTFVALALLLTSVLNYLLVVISNTVSRSREMALRKCMGSDTLDMYSMMTAESLVHTIVACIIAITLIYASRGTVETLSGTSVSDLFTGKPLFIAAIVVLFVFILNSVIPAAMYNRIPVATVFRNHVTGKRVWKRVLLAVEFSAVAFLGVLLSIITLQYNQLVTTDLGFDCTNTAIVDLGGLNASQKRALMDEIRSLPDIADATFSNQNPFGKYSGNNVLLPGSSDALFNISDGYWNDSHWFDVMGVKIVKGKSFAEDKSYDEEVLIDTKFEEMLKANTGWDDVIGKEIVVTEHSDGKSISVIAGVFESISQGLYAGEQAFYETRPMAIFYLDPDLSCNAFFYIIIKYHNLTATSVSKTKEAIEKIVPGKDMDVKPFNYQRLDDFKETLNVRNTILIGGIVTLLIAIIGLIGYTIDEVKRRSKEIAIRRISGAMFSEIRLMFIRDIMMVAVPSAIVGCVLAAIAAERWEQQFIIHASLPWWVFALAFVLTLALVAITSDIYVRIVATSNPAESIKTE